MNFFSAVAGNITVKTKHKSNLKIITFLCFATSAFYYVILFESPQTRLDSITKTKIKWLSFPSLLNIYWK